MQTKQDVVDHLLRDSAWHANSAGATTFAPANIALAKYWGKRNSHLNLPQNSSLSVTLAERGAHAQLQLADQPSLHLNGECIALDTAHAQRLLQFLALFSGPQRAHYALALNVNLPFAAGLASSSCVFAAIVRAMGTLYAWNLPLTALSILARLGSGSACRSLYSGFAIWDAGVRADGLDSYAQPLSTPWPQLAIGLNLEEIGVKTLSSREGMQRTVDTSPLYAAWPAAANHTVHDLIAAINTRHFPLFGQLAEHNALTMHATMHSAWPPVIYTTDSTLHAMRSVWRLRDEGLPVYFTQDAGPNLKLLCLRQDIPMIEPHFPKIEWVFPFATTATR